jgi:hypothetical protein
VGLANGFLGEGSRIEVATSCRVVTSIERPMALRVLRTGALVCADGKAMADASRARVYVSARARARRLDLHPPSGLFVLADLDSDASFGVGSE